MPNKISITAY